MARRGEQKKSLPHVCTSNRFTVTLSGQGTRAEVVTVPQAKGGRPTEGKGTAHLQSKCFFLGPIISSVVALQTDLASPWPARLCRAASSLSLMVCPAMLIFIVNEFSCFCTALGNAQKSHTARHLACFTASTHTHTRVVSWMHLVTGLLKHDRGH